MKLITLLSFLPPILALAANQTWTGFNYGAFWSHDSNAKHMIDFRDSFNLARNLSTVPKFDSARLFTCKTHGTLDEPTEAFEAAVQTQTNLLLGFWITPAKRGDSLDEILKHELNALKTGLKKHGRSLADLIIGVSVGSEDIYRYEQTQEPGVSGTNVAAAIKKVKEKFTESPFDTLMKGKPVGHVDTAKWAVVEGADFYGMTAYPYWNNASIAEAKESFLGSLNNVIERAKGVPVWVAETGWPFEGISRGDAVASAENQQKFWDEVGCPLVGTTPVFWFELIKDSTIEQPDWGVIDASTHQPRIKDFSCGKKKPEPPANPPRPSNNSASSSPLSTSTSASASTIHTNGTTSPSYITTIYTTITSTVTVPPSPTPSSTASNQTSLLNTTPSESSVITSPSESVKPTTPAPAPTPLPESIPWCVTVADIAWNGQFVPVAGNPARPDGTCTPPPTYTGLPYLGGMAGAVGQASTSNAAVGSIVAASK